MCFSLAYRMSCLGLVLSFNILWFTTFISMVFGYSLKLNFSSMLNVRLLADSKAGKLKKGYRSCGERCVQVGCSQWNSACEVRDRHTPEGFYHPHEMPPTP